MDRLAWQEQVEAALDGGDRAFLQVLASIAPPPGPPDTELVRCRLDAALGNTDAAAAALPDLADIEAQPDLHRAWAAAAVDLALAGITPNHWGLGRALTRLAEAASERDDPAVALDLLERHVHAALARDATAVAARGVELAEAVVDDAGAGMSRRRRQAAQAAVADLAEAVAAAPPPPAELPDSAAAVHALLGADPEADIKLLTAAATAWPDQAELLHALAHAWTALDDEAAGIDAFARGVAARPDDVDLATAFGWHLVRGGHLAILEGYVDARFLASDQPGVQARGHWLMAKARLDRAATTAALASVQRMLDLQPDSVPGRHLRAQIRRAEGHDAEALDILDQLAQQQPDDDSSTWHWDRMELGTKLGRWASVRDSAVRLGMPVQPGDAPIDERWSHCRVHLPWVDGGPKQTDLPAIRTGPVTARLIGLAAPGQRQRYGDVVLIRLEPLDSRAAGAHPEGPLFEALQVLSSGRFSVRAYDGAHPGDEALRAFGHRLLQLGAVLQWWEPKEAGDPLHARVGLPPDVDQDALAPLLAELQDALT